MSEWIEAIFENGAFHPKTPVNVAEGQRVSLHVETANSNAAEPASISDLLDVDYVQSCRQQAGQAPSLEQIRTMLGVFHGSLAERISQERDER